MPPGLPIKALPLLVLLFLSLFPAAAQEIQIRSNVELVVVPVTVKDKNGKLAGGLIQADFSLTEAGKKQNVTSFSIDPVPISAVILIDAGISEEALTRVKNSFPALVGAFADDDEIEVYRFDKHVEKLMDFTSDQVQIQRTFERLASNATPSSSSMPGGPFAEPGPVINGAPIIPGVQAAGRTIAPPSKALHDAIFRAAEDLGTRSVERRRIVLIASDGRNQGSQHSYDGALERLLLYGVQVFAFGVDTSLFQRIRSTLLSYAKATGGDAWFPDSQNALESCYSLSTEQARNQYVLGYVSSSPRPKGKPVFREIKVQLSRANMELRHRKGYYQTP
jgi:Ca-activated chloride channel family protein